MKRLNRLGLMTAALTCLAALVLPAQPAAAWGEVCKAYPGQPFFLSTKTYVLDGSSLADCDRVVELVRSRATLQKYMSSTGRWQEITTVERSYPNAKSGYVSTTASCAGMGYEARWRVEGIATAIGWSGASTEHKAIGTERTLHCGGSIPAIDD